MAKKTTHAVTGRGTKIVRCHKTGEWFLDRGKKRPLSPITITEAACLAAEGYLFPGREGGEEFERLVGGYWSRFRPENGKPKKEKATADAAA